MSGDTQGPGDHGRCPSATNSDALFDDLAHMSADGFSRRTVLGKAVRGALAACAASVFPALQPGESTAAAVPTECSICQFSSRNRRVTCSSCFTEQPWPHAPKRSSLLREARANSGYSRLLRYAKTFGLSRKESADFFYVLRDGRPEYVAVQWRLLAEYFNPPPRSADLILLRYIGASRLGWIAFLVVNTGLRTAPAYSVTIDPQTNEIVVVHPGGALLAPDLPVKSRETIAGDVLPGARATADGSCDAICTQACRAGATDACKRGVAAAVGECPKDDKVAMVACAGLVAAGCALIASGGSSACEQLCKGLCGECTAPQTACPYTFLTKGGPVTTTACFDLTTDKSNCGACGHRCANGQHCSDGSCECPPGETLCGDKCVDLGSDEDNCGGCNNNCLGATSCVGGSCVCPPGQVGCRADEGSCCQDANDACCEYVLPSGQAAYACYTPALEICCAEGGPCRQPADCTAAGCCNPGTTPCGTYPYSDCCDDDHQCCILADGSGQCCPSFDYCCPTGCHYEC